MLAMGERYDAPWVCLCRYRHPETDRSACATCGRQREEDEQRHVHVSFSRHHSFCQGCTVILGSLSGHNNARSLHVEDASMFRLYPSSLVRLLAEPAQPWMQHEGGYQVRVEMQWPLLAVYAGPHICVYDISTRVLLAALTSAAGLVSQVVFDRGAVHRQCIHLCYWVASTGAVYCVSLTPNPTTATPRSGMTTTLRTVIISGQAHGERDILIESKRGNLLDAFLTFFNPQVVVSPASRWTEFSLAPMTCSSGARTTTACSLSRFYPTKTIKRPLNR